MSWRLGRYQIRGELGRGGMGVVYEGWDPELGRAVAIKVLAESEEPAGEALVRLKEEGRVTARLEHPGIVPLYDVGDEPQVGLFLVMRKVQGQTLAAVLGELRAGAPEAVADWSLRRLLGGFVQVCNAVEFAHDAGFLHLDIKPDNVMLGSFGEVLLLDWGLARLSMADFAAEPTTIEERPVFDDLDDLPLDGATQFADDTSLGTLGYMSPEQARGEREAVDARSDVFALGATLYELLTLQRAYDGATAAARTFQLMQGAPPPPRERAPERSIPDEIAEIAMRALEPNRERRTPSVAALRAEVDAFLEGSRRREAAQRHLREANRAWRSWLDLAEEGDALSEAEAELSAGTDPWTPLPEKTQLLYVRERLAALGVDRARAWSTLLGACEQALFQDPECDEVRALLAEAHLQRFLDAESEGNDEQAVLHRERVLACDVDDRHAAVLRGRGALTLRTEPTGAEVICQRFDRRPLVWTLGEPISLGRTPLDRAPLEMGSYLLTLRHPERAEARYPVAIGRSGHWDSGVDPVPLLARGPGDGLVYVPAGPFQRGGDPGAQDPLPHAEVFVPGFVISALPVTMQEYADFLSDLHRTDPEAAWARVPRREAGVMGGDRGQYWARPGSDGIYVVPEQDTDGDRWDPRWPVMALSWEDADAYVRWRASRDDVPWALPTEHQWEKAARGVDGRAFPWGDTFDYSLCSARHSRRGPPSPEPVGQRPGDVSVYGVRDLAGGVREWCGDDMFGPDDPRRPVRGGSWHTAESWCHLATRLGFAVDYVAANQGFRLARPLRAPEGLA